MSRIGIDLDGVLYDFGGALREYMVEELGWRRKLCTNPTTWEFYHDWGLNTKGFIEVCNKAADAGKLWDTDAGDRILGRSMIEELWRLQDAGHTLHIITDRSFGRHPALSQEATARWLLKHEIPYNTLTFSRDKTIVETDYMIDDRTENYDALIETVCAPYLLDRPWNADLDNIKRARVSTVREFVDIILQTSETS